MKMGKAEKSLIIESYITRRKTNPTKEDNEKKKRKDSIRRVSLILRKSETSRTPEERRVLESNAEVAKQISKRKERIQIYKERTVEKEDHTEIIEKKAQKLAEIISQAKHLVCYTGAGISTSARIPDYRGSQGIWTLMQQGKDIGQHDLSLADPTYTHMSLYELHRRKMLRYVVSQNCDGLHLRAGLPKYSVSEVHGNMYIEVCKNCKPNIEYWRLFDTTELTSRFYHKTNRRCHICNKPLTDTIVHFGERGNLKWPLNWSAACHHAEAADVILCLGSSLKVLKKYSWLWQMDRSQKKRAKICIINLQWTPKDKLSTIKINGKCDDIMRLVMKNLNINVPSYDRRYDPIFAHATLLCTEELHTVSQPMLKIHKDKKHTESNKDGQLKKLTPSVGKKYMRSKFKIPPPMMSIKKNSYVKTNINSRHLIITEDTSSSCDESDSSTNSDDNLNDKISAENSKEYENNLHQNLVNKEQSTNYFDEISPSKLRESSDISKNSCMDNPRGKTSHCESKIKHSNLGENNSETYNLVPDSNLAFADNIHKPTDSTKLAASVQVCERGMSELEMNQDRGDNNNESKVNASNTSTTSNECNSPNLIEARNSQSNEQKSENEMGPMEVDGILHESIRLSQKISTDSTNFQSITDVEQNITEKDVSTRSQTCQLKIRDEKNIEHFSSIEANYSKPEVEQSIMRTCDKVVNINYHSNAIQSVNPILHSTPLSARNNEGKNLNVFNTLRIFRKCLNSSEEVNAKKVDAFNAEPKNLFDLSSIEIAKLASSDDYYRNFLEYCKVVESKMPYWYDVNYAYSGLHSIIQPPPPDIDLWSSITVPIFQMNRKEADCDFCFDNYAEFTCQFYRKYTSEFNIKKYRNGKLVICECCDYSDDEEQQHETYKRNEKRAKLDITLFNAPVKVQAGWYGKGCRKNYRKKKK